MERITILPETTQRPLTLMGMRAEKGNIFDLETFSMENAIMQIMTWKKGCREVTNYVKDLNANQAADIETVYMGEDYDKAGFTGQGI